MSDNISICISVDIPVSLVSGKTATETADIIKRFSSGLDLEKLRGIIDDYECTFTSSASNPATGGDVGGGEYCVGDEVYFIGDGCAVKDRITSVMVETESGYCVDIDDIFPSIDELVKHLKEYVHG